MADQQNRFFHRKKIMTIFFICALVLIGLFMRLLYLMVWRADYYEEAATRLHERERSIKEARGLYTEYTFYLKHPKNTAILNYKYHNEEGTKVNEKEWNVNAGLCTSGGIWNRMFFERSV